MGKTMLKAGKKARTGTAVLTRRVSFRIADDPTGTQKERLMERLTEYTGLFS
jgi:hypothetical protein